MQIEQKVLLLGIYKRADDESIQDVLLKLEETGMFTIKEAKKLYKNLKEKGYMENNKLSYKGLEEAKKIENEFTLK